MTLLRTTLILALVASIATGVAAAQGGSGRTLAVLNQNGTITLLDPAVGSWLGEISLGDPDGLPTTPNRPVCLAASTRNPGTVFVAHEDGWVTVVDTTLGAVLRAYPVFGDLGVTGMSLVDCAAAEPRRLAGPLVSQTKHYLHLIGQLDSGTVVGVVLDQGLLRLTGSQPRFDLVTLGTGGTPLGVVSLGTPVGDAHQRVYYQLARSDAAGDHIDNIEVAAPDDPLGTFVIGKTTRYAGDINVRRLQVGHPQDRELAVMALPNGELVNLDTGGSCTVAQDQDEIVVSGPGVNAYSVIALSRSRGELRFVDPIDCTHLVVPAPPSPTALILEADVCWEGGYLTSFSTDSVVPFNSDGTLGTPISLFGPTRRRAPGATREAERGGCLYCPIDGELLEPSCSIEEINVSIGDFDATTPDRDVRVSIDSTCPPGTKFRFKCQCFEKEVQDCPCICDCNLPPDQIDPACECGALPFLQMTLGPGQLGLMSKPDDDFVGNNPWRKLGDFIGDGPIVFPDVGEQDGSWVYTVEPLP